MGMVLSSVIIAFFFVFKQTSEFTKATVVTTVDTTTAPLTDVFFPAVTICNINQVSYLICLFWLSLEDIIWIYDILIFANFQIFLLVAFVCLFIYLVLKHSLQGLVKDLSKLEMWKNKYKYK